MESNQLPSDPRQQLREIERGEAASWITHRPTPIWYAPFFAVGVGLLALAIGLLDGRERVAVQLAFILVMFALMSWYRRYHGTYPTGRAPREFRRSLVGLVVGALVVAGLAWAVGALVSVWLGAALATALTWLLLGWYEREYAVAAARARRRIG
jgi:hypothetical protein